MIGGGKVVGTLGRLDAELIADNKREKKLLGLSVILSPWGRPNQNEKLGGEELREVINLSYRITPVGTHRLSQTLSQTLTSGLLRQAYLEPSAIVCVCVAFWLFPTNESIGKKVRSFLGGMVIVHVV